MQQILFKLKYLGLKILKKLEILKFINFKTNIYLNEKKLEFHLSMVLGLQILF